MTDVQPTMPIEQRSLPPRDEHGHKGTFGSLLVIGGCAHGPVRMLGAPVLAGLGALRSGVGRVTLAVPERIAEHVIHMLPSATGVALSQDASGQLVRHEVASAIDDALESADAVAIGPGLGDEPAIEDLVLRVLAQDRVPVVVDADALNALSRIDGVWEGVRAPCVLTPHPGEWQRLADRLGIAGCPTDPEARTEAARALAMRTGCIVVLKGAGTVVSDGVTSWTCTRACSALATGGTGDVLAGLLGGLIARLVPVHRPELARLPEAARARMPSDPARPLSFFDAACLAVDVHAACAEQWTQRQQASGGMLASELTDEIAGELQRRTRVSD